MAKNELTAIESAIARAEKTIAKLNKEKLEIQEKWKRLFRRDRETGSAFHALQAEVVANPTVRALKRLISKKATSMLETLSSWDQTTKDLTEARNAKANAVQAEEAKLADLRMQKKLLEERLLRDARENDDIVHQIFSLTDSVVTALRARNQYLVQHVFRKLAQPDGTTLSQLTLQSTDGLQKVQVRTNYISRLDSALAAEALAEIRKFFGRFQQETEMDETTRALAKLLDSILIEKIKFDIGPTLYLFLGSDIDAAAFPELHRAQSLLSQSLRSDRSNHYIRLWQKATTDGNWEEVKLS
jgi:hypothetical protein